MADISLDDYIGFNKNRLGPKISPGKANLKITTNTVKNPGTRFKVVGVGNFDARQRLQNKNKRPLNDARVNLNQRTRMSDARMKIQNKRVGAGGIQIKRPIPRITAPSPGHKTPDVRIKIKNSQQAQAVDARQMIKTRNQGQKQTNIQRPFQAQRSQPPQSQPQRSFQGQSAGQAQVTVTGIGRVINQENVQQSSGDMGEITSIRGGSLKRTIPSSQNRQSLPIKKTIQNLHFAPMPSSRVGNNIVISPEDPYMARQHVPVQQEYADWGSLQYADGTPQQPTYSQQQLTEMPMIRIQNESYSRPPPPPPPVRMAEATPPPAPAYQHNYYPEIDPDMVQIPPVAQPLRLHSHVERSQQQERIQHVERFQHAERTPHMDRPQHVDRSQLVERSQHVERPLSHHSHQSRPLVEHMERTTSHVASPRSLIQSRLGEDPQDAEQDDQDTSPLQGYRVQITNLNHVVSQDDVLELFGAVGALKKVKLLRPGNAEVVFVQREDAVAAIRKYNNRELDGQPMRVVLASTSRVKSPRASSQVNQDIARLQRASTSVAGDSSPVDVDIGLLHKALFKTSSKDEPPQRPVTFTVKI